MHLVHTLKRSCACCSAVRFLLVLLCLASLSACHGGILSEPDDSNTTSGSVGPFVPTSDIRLSALSFYAPLYAPSGLIIDFKQADTLEPLRVGAGDALQVVLDNVSQSIQEVRAISCSGKIGPCRYTYYYRVSFSGNPEGKPMTISLDRLNGLSSHTTVTFPMMPAITDPVADSVISLATDTLAVSWQAGEAGDDTRLRLSAECGVGEELWFDGPAGGYSFPAGTFQFSTNSSYCANATELSLDVDLIRYRYYTADPALAANSGVELSLENYISLRIRP